MFHQLERSQAKAYIIYNTETEMFDYLKQKLQQKHDIRSYYITEAKSKVEIEEQRLKTMYPALDGGYWLSIIHIDYMKIEDILKILKQQNYGEILVLRISNYGTYQKLRKSKAIEDMQEEIQDIYSAKIDLRDMVYLEESILGKRQIEEDLIKKVYITYKSTPNKVVQFFTLYKQGVILESQQALVEYLGLGKIKPIDVLFLILQKSPRPCTQRKATNFMKKYVILIQLLLQDKKMNVYMLYKYLYKCLESMRDIKYIQLQGYTVEEYVKDNKGKDTKGIQAVRGYAESIKEISMYELVLLADIMQRMGAEFKYTKEVLPFMQLAIQYIKETQSIGKE